MADLTSRGDHVDGDTRGQVLLVAAFALAITFVALALVANSAIYTENLATRAGSEDTTDVLTFRDSVEKAVGGSIRAANERESSTFGPIDTAVQSGIQNVSDWTSKQEARESALVSVEHVTNTQGTRIAQSNASQFLSSNTSTAPRPNWTVAEDVSGTRAFEITVTDTATLATTSSDEFTVTATAMGGTESWELHVGEDGSGAVEVTVERENPAVSASCTAPVTGDPVTVDVTAGTVGGADCPALDVVSGEEMHFGAGVSTPYDITITNGDHIEGRYSLVVDNATLGSNPDVSAAVGDPLTNETQPYAYPAMYSATVDVSYYTDVVEYRSEIRVVPGEPS